MYPPQRTSSRRPDRLRLRACGALVLVSLVLLALGAGATGTHAASQQRTRVTVIGDSVTESFDYVPAAKRYLGRGLDLRADAVVCRRLVAASCAFQGTAPATALQVVGADGRSLGPVVVVNVGYNDWAAVYDVDRVVRALRGAGVRHVIWVTLREAGANASIYAQSNARIRSASKRWGTTFTIADWNSYSRGKSWFSADGLHLSPSGAFGLARLLRPLVLAGARG
jgi:hypothetical protein